VADILIAVTDGLKGIGEVRISAHRGRRFRLIVDGVSA
jgi:hypothetical protein